MVSTIIYLTALGLIAAAVYQLRRLIQSPPEGRRELLIQSLGYGACGFLLLIIGRLI